MSDHSTQPQNAALSTAPLTNAPLSAAPRTDQHNTALKWGSDGELSELDLQRILRLLSQTDPVAEALIRGASDSAA